MNDFPLRDAPLRIAFSVLSTNDMAKQWADLEKIFANPTEGKVRVATRKCSSCQHCSLSGTPNGTNTLVVHAQCTNPHASEPRPCYIPSAESGPRIRQSTPNWGDW